MHSLHLLNSVHRMRVVWNIRVILEFSEWHMCAIICMPICYLPRTFNSHLHCLYEPMRHLCKFSNLLHVMRCIILPINVYTYMCERVPNRTVRRHIDAYLHELRQRVHSLHHISHHLHGLHHQRDIRVLPYFHLMRSIDIMSF